MLVGEIFQPGSNYDIAVVSLAQEPELSALVGTPARERYPDLSPDGRWITYSSDESGQSEVFVRPFPNVDEGKWQISRGGTKPLWSAQGDEIFYRNGNQVMSVSVRSTDPFDYTVPRLLFEGSYDEGYNRDWDVTPDGQRFLMMKANEVETGDFVIVLNFFDELKRLVPTD